MSEQNFTISDLEQMVAEHEASAARVKAIINELCVKSNLPPRYAAYELERRSGGFKIRSDQFHGRPLATCVKELLEMRRSAGMGPATTNEIFDSLLEGAYEVGAKNTQVARVSMYNSINKNPAFYKLPNKTWGLRDWYPNAKSPDDEIDPTGDNGKLRKSGSRKKSKKAKTAAKAKPKTEPAQPAPGTAAAPGNGDFSAQRLEEYVREKSRRVKDVAIHFSVTKAKVKRLLGEPNSKVYQAEKGWLKVRE